MAVSTTTLDEARGVIERGIAELDREIADLTEKRDKLQGAGDALGGKPRKRRPGRPRGSKRSSTASTGNGRRGGRRGGRRKGGITQEVRLLQLAQTNPDADNQAVADHLGIKLSTATAFVAKTKAKGLITRENKKLVVTRAGQAFLKEQLEPGADKASGSRGSGSSTKSKAKGSGRGSQKRSSKKASSKRRSKAAAKAAGAKADGSDAAKGSTGEAGSDGGDQGGQGGQGGQGTDGSGGSKPGNVLYDKG